MPESEKPLMKRQIAVTDDNKLNFQKFCEKFEIMAYCQAQ